MGDDRYSTHSPLTVEPVILELLNKLTVLVSQGLSLKRDGFYWGHMDYYKRCRLDMVVLRCRYLWVEKGVLCYERNIIGKSNKEYYDTKHPEGCSAFL